jgi:hypothetical protein
MLPRPLLFRKALIFPIQALVGVGGGGCAEDRSVECVLMTTREVLPGVKIAGLRWVRPSASTAAEAYRIGGALAKRGVAIESRCTVLASDCGGMAATVLVWGGGL